MIYTNITFLSLPRILFFGSGPDKAGSRALTQSSQKTISSNHPPQLGLQKIISHLTCMMDSFLLYRKGKTCHVAELAIKVLNLPFTADAHAFNQSAHLS